jgi:mono/diheme cytochrome c family protein
MEAGTTPAPKATGGSPLDNCGSCHTYAPARTTGAVGPSLDGVGVTAEEAAEIVTSRRGSIPPFGDSLDEAQINAIAKFVAGPSGS